MTRSVSEISDDIENIEDVAVEELQFRFLKRPQNKTTKLIATSGKAERVEGRHRSFDYDFKEPVFLSHVVIDAEGYYPSDQFYFEVRGDGKKSRFGYVRSTNDVIVIEVNEYCSGFSFTPPRTWLRSTYVDSVRVYGFDKSKTDEFINFANEIEDLKSEALAEIERTAAEANDLLATARARESQRDSILSEISDAETKLSGVRSDISSQSAELSEIVAKVGSAQTQLDNLNEQQKRVRSEVNDLTSNRDDLKNKVSESEKRLTKLQKEIDIFPSELSGFLEQAANDIETYKRYTVGCIAIICILFIWVLSGSFDLSEFVKANPKRDVWSLIAAKLPMSVVVAALITAAYKLARIFVQEQMNINRQKLSLTQMSIIAKDISQSSEHGLDLSREEEYSARLRVRMAMLSDHLKTFIISNPSELLPKKLFGMTRSSGNANDEWPVPNSRSSGG